MFNLKYIANIFREGKMIVAYSPEFDVSSCGYTVEEAQLNLKDALLGFLESARDRGVLPEILEEAGYKLKSENHWQPPEFLKLETSSLTLQHA